LILFYIGCGVLILIFIITQWRKKNHGIFCCKSRDRYQTSTIDKNTVITHSTHNIDCENTDTITGTYNRRRTTLLMDTNNEKVNVIITQPSNDSLKNSSIINENFQDNIASSSNNQNDTCFINEAFDDNLITSVEVHVTNSNESLSDKNERKSEDDKKVLDSINEEEPEEVSTKSEVNDNDKDDDDDENDDVFEVITVDNDSKIPEIKEEAKGCLNEGFQDNKIDELKE
jgi:hypothetical protein